MTDSPQNPDDVNLTLYEAKAFLDGIGIHLHEETLRSYARSGFLPFFKFNPKNRTDPYLIRRGDLRKHIMRQQVEASRQASAR